MTTTAPAHATHEILTRDGAVVRAVAAAPERVVLVAVALAISAGVWVNLGQFRWWLVIPTAAAISALGWRMVTPRHRDIAAARGSGFALLGALAWVIINIPWAAEYIVVRRDPGFLTLSGIWLVDHHNTDMPLLGAGDAAHLSPTLSSDAAEAWNRDGDAVQPQGAKMVPAIIAIGGWLAGLTGVFTANIVVAGAGLLAVYALARRFMGPIAALAPAVGLSLSASHIWLARAPYTEIATLLLLVAAVTWAWQGVEKGKALPLVFASVASASITFARIDGPIYAVGIAAGVSLALLLSSVRTALWRLAATFIVLGSQWLIVFLAAAGLERWSRDYVARLGDRATQLESVYELALIALAAVSAGVFATRFAHHREESARQARAALEATTKAKRAAQQKITDAHAAARRRRGHLLGLAAAGAMLALWIGLASRPLWMTARNPDRSNFHKTLMEFMQRQAGQDIDPLRTYNESTVTWVSYYLGWPLIALGVIGLAVMAYRLLTGRPAWAVVIGGFMAPALLYLWKPSIVSDQVWAIRRLSAGAIVGLILAGALAWQWAVKRWSVARDGAGVTLISLVLAGVVAVSPLVSWLSIRPGDEVPVAANTALFVKEQGGARYQLEQLCASIDHRPTVLVGTSSHFGTVRAGCDAPVILAFEAMNKRQLKSITEAWGVEPVVITRSVDKVPWQSEPTNPTFYSRMVFVPGWLGSMPRDPSKQKYNWYIGEAQPDGSVIQILGPGQGGPPDDDAS